MQKYSLLLFWLFLVALPSGEVFAAGDGKKVALVIGNSNYAHSVALSNPANDAALIAAALRDAGFEVIEGRDLGKTAMNEKVDQFAEAAYDAEVALVYYAGHGMQIDNQNYLIPVDAQLEKAAQLQSRTISVSYMLSKLPPDPAVSILILDACRDNPFARALAAALPKTRSSAVGVGLAAVQANAQSYGSGGLLIAYATDPGAVAYDGGEQHSPYSAALTRHLTTPGLEIQAALTRVRADVSRETTGAQRPWHNASLAREVFLGGEVVVVDERAPETAALTEGPVQAVDSIEQTTWDEVSKRNTIAHYDYYILKFPEGQFVGLARINIDQLRAAETRTSAAVPAEEKVAVLSVGPPNGKVDGGDKLRQVPGTLETEALLKLDKKGRIDLQMRLSALGYDIGGFDGALGARTRSAIGKWQRQNSLIETSYLTPEQHLLLVTETRSLIARVQAPHEDNKVTTRKYDQKKSKQKSYTYQEK